MSFITSLRGEWRDTTQVNLTNKKKGKFVNEIWSFPLLWHVYVCLPIFTGKERFYTQWTIWKKEESKFAYFIFNSKSWWCFKDYVLIVDFPAFKTFHSVWRNVYVVRWNKVLDLSLWGKLLYLSVFIPHFNSVHPTESIRLYLKDILCQLSPIRYVVIRKS